MKLLDGKKIAQEKLMQLKKRVAALSRVPSLAVMLVGDDPASHLYVELKEKAAKKVGIDFHKYLLSADEAPEHVYETISFLRDDDDVDAMIVQLPLPQGFSTDAAITAMGAAKDADGFHPENIEKFIVGDDVPWPVFPQALVTLAEASGENLDGKNAVIVGKSDVFLRAMDAACARVGLQPMHVPCTAITEHANALREADVIFTACGVARCMSGEEIKDGAIIIDGGITTVDGVTVGDVDGESVADKAAFYSPVPGGVGPVTIACLLENVVDLSCKRISDN